MTTKYLALLLLLIAPTCTFAFGPALRHMPIEVRGTAIAGSRVVTATVAGEISGPITKIEVPTAAFDTVTDVAGTGPPALSKSFTTTYANYSADFTLPSDRLFVYVDADSNNVNITVPNNAGQSWFVKLVTEPGTFTVTITPALGTVDGQATNTTVLVDQYDAVMISVANSNVWLH